MCLTVESLEKARDMLLNTNFDSVKAIAIMPDYLLVPPSFEEPADRVLTTIVTEIKTVGNYQLNRFYYDGYFKKGGQTEIDYIWKRESNIFFTTERDIKLEDFCRTIRADFT